MASQFPKGLIPAYGPLTTPYGTDRVMENPDHLTDLVKHIKMHHVKMGKAKPSSAQVLAKIDEHSRSLGLEPAVGRGLMGDIWSAVKSGAQKLGSAAWNQFLSDPQGTLNAVTKLFSDVPVI